MKKSIYLLVMTVLTGTLVTGCISPQGRPDYTASGALAGGATGAVIGSIADPHHSGAGALVGGAVGAVVGGLVGHSLDQEQEARLQSQSPQTWQHIDKNQALTTYDVRTLAQAGISDEIIISQIRNSRTVYHLTTADIIGLKNAGVSDNVIDFMINTPNQVSSSSAVSVVGNPPPAPLPEAVPPAPGPGFIWIDGSWLWIIDHWDWHPGYWHHGSRHHPGPGWR